MLMNVHYARMTVRALPFVRIPLGIMSVIVPPGMVEFRVQVLEMYFILQCILYNNFIPGWGAR